MVERTECAGRSLLELMEDRLDAAVLELAVLTTQRPNDLAMLGAQGRAQGIAECIALIRTPYAPDVDAVKAAASARYQAALQPAM